MVEREHASLIDALSKFCQGNPEVWPDKLTLALWADRIAWKRTTEESPYKLLFGQESVLPIELKYQTWNTLNLDSTKTTENLISAHVYQPEAKEDLVTDVAQKLKEFRERNRVYFESIHKIRRDALKTGEIVLLYDSTIGKSRQSKLDDIWMGPYMIESSSGNGSYRIKELDGTIKRTPVAGNRLRRF
ncbi:hypothetical protein AYI68_g7230 [Smittium mucronatum]|uniref:Uncharacterized protein n=1 Tax=Smittium mucronatum TaxID=133383 RepID=A0A1R0GP92_9FUNG|nr:hypothetical protein AYI68_g7230 [Smittium mucronatum]